MLLEIDVDIDVVNYLREKANLLREEAKVLEAQADEAEANEWLLSFDGSD